MLEIWSTKPQDSKNEYYFIIDTFNYSVYTRKRESGVLFFDNLGKAQEELRNLEEEKIFGYWLGG